jgi:hypothetical protein
MQKEKLQFEVIPNCAFAVWNRSKEDRLRQIKYAACSGTRYALNGRRHRRPFPMKLPELWHYVGQQGLIALICHKKYAASFIERSSETWNFVAILAVLER